MGSIGDVGAGHTLGRYELLVPIAVGGMASVWAARMTGAVQKIVAVKLMRTEFSDDADFEQMFLDEAAVVSHIRHPNVAEILDLGEEDGTLYQVMEYVDGEPLNVVLREAKARGGVPLPILLRIIKQVCAGLHAAHELRGPDGTLVGLVHRDVSPQNILVGYDGMVKIVDFGVAKAALNKQNTRIGDVKGKAPYMSPEQALGQRVDRRADIFALGIVLYQLTTGAHPFLGANEFETMRRISSGAPCEPPRSLAPALPEALEQIVLRALEHTPDARFASMLEMLRALDRATPPDMQVSVEQVAEYMRQTVGPRGERRRAAIREAVQIAQAERAQTERPASITRAFPADPRPFPLASTSSPELAAIVQAAAAAAQGGPRMPLPGVAPAAMPPWAMPSPLRRNRGAILGAIGIGLILVIGALTILTRAIRPAPPAPLLSTRGVVHRAALDAAEASRLPPRTPPRTPAPPPPPAPAQKP